MFPTVPVKRAFIASLTVNAVRFAFENMIDYQGIDALKVRK